MPATKNKIPDGWRDFSNIGDVVEGTRFIGLKVPLKSNLLSMIPVSERWGISDLLQTQNLGMIVDLTFTDKYYNGRDITKKGLQYVKIKTQGHGIPSQEVVDKFYEAVDSFLVEDEDQLIGVHCTHGINRTGYLICRYMIERMGVDPDEAIEEFATARGHEIERRHYITHLRSREWEH